MKSTLPLYPPRQIVHTLQEALFILNMARVEMKRALKALG